jgi:hypothetical protein
MGVSYIKLIEDMEREGAPLGAIKVAIRAIEQTELEDCERRAKNRNRVRRQREAKRAVSNCNTKDSVPAQVSTCAATVPVKVSPLFPPSSSSPPYPPNNYSPTITPHPKHLSAFSEFWELFPRQRRGSRVKAQKAWESAVKITTPEEIHAAVIRYCSSRDVAEGFAKGAAVWLNGEHWNDEPVSATAKRATNGKPTYFDNLENASRIATDYLRRSDGLRDEDVF